jgi:hypothetical protein
MGLIFRHPVLHVNLKGGKNALGQLAFFFKKKKLCKEWADLLGSRGALSEEDSDRIVAGWVELLGC